MKLCCFFFLWTFFLFLQSDTHTHLPLVFFQQTFDWYSGEIFSFCIRQWTTGIHHEIKGFARTELNTDLRSAVLLGHCRDEILFRNGIRNPVLWLQSNSKDSGSQNERNHRSCSLFGAELLQKMLMSVRRFTNIYSITRFQWDWPCVCVYMRSAGFLRALWIYLMTSGGYSLL